MKLILHLQEDYLLNGKKRRFQLNLMLQIYVFDNSMEFLNLKRMNQMKQWNSSIEKLNSTETNFHSKQSNWKESLVFNWFHSFSNCCFHHFYHFETKIWWNSLNWLFLNNFGQKEKFLSFQLFFEVKKERKWKVFLCFSNCYYWI